MRRLAEQLRAAALEDATARAGQREDLDVHRASLHEHEHDEGWPDGQVPPWLHGHEHEHDGVRHRHMHEHAMPNPYRSGDGGATADRIDREWTPLLQDLLELEAAGALGGIRAVIAERLRQVRDGWESHDDMPNAAKVMIKAGRPDTAAALLAAEYDRLQAGTGS